MSYIITFAILIALIIAFGIIIPRLTGRLNTKINLLFVCGYLALLVALSASCLLVPDKALVRVDTPTISDGGVHNDYLFWLRFFSGNFSAPKGFVQTVNSFKPQSKTLAVKSQLNFSNVWVGKKGVNVPDNHNGKIDVYFFAQTPLTFVNFKYHPKIDPVKVAYKGSTLSLKSVQQQLFELSGFDDRQAALQFYNGSDNIFNMVSMSDYELIVVLLPKGVNVRIGDYSTYPTY
jgi:hypothetical protein